MRTCCLALLTFTLFTAVPATAAEIVVTMTDASYTPAKINASVGDTLRFVNRDGTNHAVFIPTAAFSADLGKQEPGSEKVMTVGKAGTFEVECVIHANMLTVVEVK